MTLPAPATLQPTLPRAVVAAGITVLAWACAFPLIRVALREVAPVPLASARFALAALVLLGWLAWARPRRPSWRDALRFLACGLLGIALYNAALNAGQRTVSAGGASFIVNIVPIFTAALAMVFLGERLKPWGWAGSLISLSGVAVIASGQAGGIAFGAGASFVLAAAACSAAYFVLQRPLVPRYGALASTCYTLVAGALLLTPWLPAGVSSLMAASAGARGAVLALALVPSVIGFAAWTYALGYFGAARASNALFLVPPVATALAVPLAGELPGPTTLLGGVVVIAGLVVFNTLGRR